MRWFDLLRFRKQRRARAAGLELPSVERDRIQHLLTWEHGFPHVDWGMAAAWGQKEGVPRRAIAAAWLDEMRDSGDGDYRRWRHATIEGLAAGEAAARTMKTGDRALKIVSASLQRVLNNVESPEFGLIVLPGNEAYISFTAHHHPAEGEWATSGGCYINQGADSFPIIVTHAGARWSLELTIAHELAHHLLYEFGLPLWVEEGFTQMMEERVTGYTSFKLDRELIQRQRDRWQVGLGSFFSGDAFHSGEQDDQELAYHLAEWIARTELSLRPAAYFDFVRGCAEGTPEEAARQHLGCDLVELVAAKLGLDPGDCEGPSPQNFGRGY